MPNIKYILILSIFCISINNVATVCIMGDNCPYGKGICRADSCFCLYGYQTLLAKGDPNPIYCNYPQKSRWIAFILELIVLPSLGLFYLGRFVHAVIKLILFICVLIYKKRPQDLPGWIALCFIFMYFTDLFCLLFALYSDGNGIPLL